MVLSGISIPLAGSMEVGMKTKIITISVSGPVGSGKSAVLQSIATMLQDYNYCVAIPDRSERTNPSDDLEHAKDHERPSKDHTVIVLTEHGGRCGE